MTVDSGAPEVAVKPDYREDAVRAVVDRLSRKHPSGGTVIERAAILAEGRHAHDVVAWVIAHGGEPESAVVAPKRGLHGPRMSDPTADARTPLRYVLPAGALAADAAEEAPVS